MLDADPLAPGLDPGNSFRATLLAHDDGAYIFAQGAELRRQSTVRGATEVTLGVRSARELPPNGVVRAGDRVPQRSFRLGGAQTLRGYEAGAFRRASACVWSVIVSLAGRLVAPEVFADVGQVAARRLAFAGRPRASVGAGVSVLWGLVRIHVARAVESGASWRFDVVFGSLRQATASRSCPPDFRRHRIRSTLRDPDRRSGARGTTLR
jgi:hypothetical protein